MKGHFFQTSTKTFFGSSLKEVITRKRGEGIAGKSGEIRVRKEENYEDQSNYQQCRKKPEKGLKRWQSWKTERGSEIKKVPEFW